MQWRPVKYNPPGNTVQRRLHSTFVRTITFVPRRLTRMLASGNGLSGLPNTATDHLMVTASRWARGTLMTVRPLPRTHGGVLLNQREPLRPAPRSEPTGVPRVRPMPAASCAKVICACFGSGAPQNLARRVDPPAQPS